MPRRCNGYANDDDPPLKKLCGVSAVYLESNEFLTDITGKQWRIGKTVGVGGFGEIHLASDDLANNVKTDCPFVAKIESHSSGPLFVEINCYLRIAKQSMIEKWKTARNLTSLGMPHYIASGSLNRKNDKYRFLILPRFEEDLERVLNNRKVLNLKTVLTISCQIIDVLEYIHSKGYIHSDIKASNILYNTHKMDSRKSQSRSQSRISTQSPSKPLKNRLRTRAVYKSPVKSTSLILRPKHIVNYCDDFPEWDDEYAEQINEIEKFQKPLDDLNHDQVYLLDYGLASKYVLSNGEHRPFCVDERKAHAGTLLFCSRDAHKGVPTRRSDLESLGYNMIYWLIGSLPWLKDLHDPEIVHKTKEKFIANPAAYLEACFEDYPKFLMEYIQYLQNLQYQETPDYEYCKGLFKKTLREYGYKDNSKFDFENLEGWGQKQKKLKYKHGENPRTPKFIYKISRPPLRSNILIRRKKKAHVKKPMKWSQIWIDPETILKQAREKKSIENSDSDIALSIADMDIDSLKPTYAMLEIYNKCKEGSETNLDRVDSSSSIDGYTPAMMLAYQIMKKRQREESDSEAVNIKTGKSGKRRKVVQTPARREIHQAKTRKTLKRNHRG